MIKQKGDGALTAVKIHYLSEVCSLLTHHSLEFVRSAGTIKNHANRIRQSASAIKTTLAVDNIRMIERREENVFDEKSELYHLIELVFKLGLSSLPEINQVLKELFKSKIDSDHDSLDL
ncbi:hypothetical protein [Sphingobacterium deserti]|uniref:Uncharacterized protein n=1 Tax=Sphingobacterium deserti TaxID=1229276 RepID=A0A0B8T1L9_9SPHI|nr:hypothetical protein [Sphingobacterium deserti]KGE14581.1 hypothetical protein DI53_1610 [Sphingobacterium deserti]